MKQKLLKLKNNLPIMIMINILLPHKNITTPEFNNLSARVFTLRLAQANLITKIDFDDKIKSLKQNKTFTR